MFRWKAGQNPFLITPAGKKVVFEVDGYVPYFSENPDGDPGEASDPNVTNTAPAAAAIGTGSGSSSGSSSSGAQAPHSTVSGGNSAVSLRLAQAPPRAVMTLWLMQLWIRSQGGSRLARPT